MISKNRIKHIKSLHQKKFRDQFEEFLVEGLKNVSEAYQIKKEFITAIYCTETKLLDLFPEAVLISELEMKLVSTLNTPSNIIAICKIWKPTLLLEGTILMLDDIQDPGNFGTMIRSADWFGVKTIICSKNTADCFNPKVVQATMGSIFRVNIIYTDLSSFLEKNKLPVYSTFMDGVSIFEEKLEQHCILIMGNEGNGISKTVETFTNKRIAIPKYGHGESLNVAIATSIVLSTIVKN
jgi:RNA methyltransferase, TrmH family